MVLEQSCGCRVPWRVRDGRACVCVNVVLICTLVDIDEAQAGISVNLGENISVR